MRINSSGNVGIGTTNPDHKLHIFGANALNIDTAAAGVPLARFSIAGTNKWGLLVNHVGTDDFGIYDYSGTPGYRLVIQDTTGNVGIGGATNPSAALNIGAF